MEFSESSFKETTDSRIINNSLHDGRAFTSIDKFVNEFYTYIEEINEIRYGKTTTDNYELYTFTHDGIKYYAHHG